MKLLDNSDLNYTLLYQQLYQIFSIKESRLELLISSKEIISTTRVRIMGKAAYISIFANAFGKCMNVWVSCQIWVT